MTASRSHSKPAEKSRPKFWFFQMPGPDSLPRRALSKQSQIGQRGKTGRGKISRGLFSPPFRIKKSGQIKGADFLLMFRGRHWYIDHVSVWQVILNNIQFALDAEECSSLIFRLISKGAGGPVMVSICILPPYPTTLEDTGWLQSNVHEKPCLNGGERNLK